jgi:hypothetical protein
MIWSRADLTWGRFDWGRFDLGPILFGADLTCYLLLYQYYSKILITWMCCFEVDNTIISAIKKSNYGIGLKKKGFSTHVRSSGVVDKTTIAVVWATTYCLPLYGNMYVPVVCKVVSLVSRFLWNIQKVLLLLYSKIVKKYVRYNNKHYSIAIWDSNSYIQHIRYKTYTKMYMHVIK